MSDAAAQAQGEGWLSVFPGGRTLRVPQLNGRLLTDETALQAAADDFGHIVHGRPLAVLEPASAQDIQRMVSFAREHRLKIGPRGQGHSAYGQSQVAAGIMVRMSTLLVPPVFGDGWVEVSAGMTWREVLRATLQRGLRPPVLTHNTGLSVGGTLSMGGIDGGSYRHGAQVDNVLALQVVTGEGRLQTCSAVEQPELFNAVLAGLGQCAIILRARLRLIPATTHARLFRLFYPDLPAMLRDERLLISDGRFDRLVGNIWPLPIGGWLYFIDANYNFDHSSLPDSGTLLAGLHFVPHSERIHDLTLFDAVGRNPRLDELTRNARVGLPHPWFDVFVPGTVMEEFGAEFFAGLVPAETATDFPAPFFPLHPALSTRPLLRLPDEPIAFLFDFLCTVPDPAAASLMLDRNRQFYERLRSLGGSLYPIGATPLSPQGWQAHFGSQWEPFASAKRRYDPDNVLTPGPNIFGDWGE